MTRKKHFSGTGITVNGTLLNLNALLIIMTHMPIHEDTIAGFIF